MAKYTMQHADLQINGTSYQDHVSSITLTDTAEQIDFTTFSPNAYKSYGQGMRDAKIAATFFSDFASASVHSVLQSMYANGTAGTVSVIPDSTVGVSATNPRASMIAKLYQYGGIDGAVGAAATMQVEFLNSGTAGLTWGTV